jgi:ABC-2 type transport system permease protein
MSEERGERIRHPLIELSIARVKEFVREPEALFWTFVFPILLALGLGIAFREKPPEKMLVAIVNSSESAKLSRMIAKSPQLQAEIIESDQADKTLSTGKSDLVICPGSLTPTGEPAEKIPPANAANQKPPDFYFIYDHTRPASQAARLAAQDALERGMGRKDLITISDRKVTAQGSRYIDFLIPGLIAMNLMGSGMWGLGFTVVLARTRKLLKRLAATPMRRSHYLLAFMFSRLIFLFVEVVVLVGFGWVAFGVRVNGSILSLAVISLMGSMTFAGMGLLVASRTNTIEAAGGWMNLVMMPQYLLSGAFFPYSRFPEIFIPLIRALPLTALNDAMRGVMNFGAPIHSLWIELLVLSAWGITSFAVALKIFKWQ